MGTARTLAVVTVLGLAPLLAGCGGQGSGASSATAATSAASSAAPTTDRAQSPDASSTPGTTSPAPPTSPATTGPTTTGAAGRDATEADLRGITLPRACGVADVRLTGGKGSNGELTQVRAVADLDGDGAKDVVGVYSCLLATQRPGRAVLVAARSGGRLLGSAEVGDDAYSAVTALTPAARGVAVSWDSHVSGYQPPTTHRGTVTWTGTRLTVTEAPPTSSAAAPARSADAGGPASVVTGITEFASPSGNVLCSLGDQGATCTADAVSFTAPPDPGCDGQWGHTITLSPSAAATFVCKQDAFAGTDPKPSWWMPGTDSTVAALGWASAPALGYGHRLRNGATTCEVKQSSGVTCTNGGHGFSLARQSYRVW